ncbi:hypothetical protein CC78DRAFT_326073 [Lojkania enalia]|uniref:Uncharacterized protein n=1 Tax=Lojkania enalia TaxID=147567 RepID=A0A9P4N168_9PLEO|nr:hypothetical protein CC78DRAFT_326073 [Didymosphaeria enalia]
MVDLTDGSRPLINRQTAKNNIGRFIVNPDDSTSGLNRTYPRQVYCKVNIIINTTSTSTATTEPTTSVEPQSTENFLNICAIIITTMVTEIMPAPIFYAVCAQKNLGKYIAYD